MDKRDLIERCREHNVRFVRLQFTELYGQLKNVSIPVEEIERALDNELMFDGSSIRGYKRIEQSDMYFHPDPSTFTVLPWRERESGAVARLICDVADPDGTPFAGDPRVALKRVMAEAAEMGYTMQVGPEAEFFLFKRAPDGTPLVDPHDRAGYFDVAPMDLGENTRRDIEDTLVKMGFDLEASHHEVAIGQHEIDFRHAEALRCADNLITFRWVVRVIAAQHGMHATFMPKPIYGENGSGMHTNMSLSTANGDNAFYDPKDDLQLSDVAYGYIAGVLEHVRGITAVANPTVNSYKRLVPGYEAPVYIAWSPGNRSAAIRVPNKRGRSTRAELRTPDPTANPYLAYAVMLAAGLDGIKRGLKPPAPVNKNIYHLDEAESAELGIGRLPHNLSYALDALESDDVLRSALGDHIAEAFLAEKRAEWSEYQAQVHQWEIDKYMETF
jgi:glutamine synthetase